MVLLNRMMISWMEKYIQQIDILKSEFNRSLGVFDYWTNYFSTKKQVCVYIEIENWNSDFFSSFLRLHKLYFCYFLHFVTVFLIFCYFRNCNIWRICDIKGRKCRFSSFTTQKLRNLWDFPLKNVFSQKFLQEIIVNLRFSKLQKLNSQRVVFWSLVSLVRTIFSQNFRHLPLFQAKNICYERSHSQVLSKNNEFTPFFNLNS